MDYLKLLNVALENLNKEKVMADEATKNRNRLVTAEEFERGINDPETQKRVTATFRELLEELHRGLPRATSGFLLNSRVDF